MNPDWLGLGHGPIAQVRWVLPNLPGFNVLNIEDIKTGKVGQLLVLTSKEPWQGWLIG